MLVKLFNLILFLIIKLYIIGKFYIIIGTFDKTIRDWPSCGGCNASIRFDNEIDHSSNAGLSKAIALLEPIKNKYKIVSWSDLIQMAGSLSVELLGGPKINMVYGRIDASPPLNSFLKEENKQNIKPFDSDEILADRLPRPQPPYPDGSPSADVHLRNIFYRMGFTNREAVSLCGAHTIGRGFKNRSGVCPFSTGNYIILNFII
jgi:L-ascorbate peroxidase